MGKKKYYVVWEGVRPGIYESWDECKRNIKNYPNARYKSYKSLMEAEDAYYTESGIKLPTPKVKNTLPKDIHSKIISKSISVDAACSGNPGIMEYRGVKTMSGGQIFHRGPFKHGTNNIGEFLALVHALALLKKKNREDIAIYTDSKTAMAWVRNKQVKTTLKRTKDNKELFELVERAIIWLKSNTYSTQIIKWDTSNWGEIPADFGRK